MKKPAKTRLAQRDALYDIPEITAAQFRTSRPAREVEPDLVAASLRRRARGPQKAPTKTPVSLRLSRDVLAHFKATGAGWQTRLDDALRLLIGTRSS